MRRIHLGLNLGHDRAAALVQDGEILVAIEQERLDRCKHSTGFMLQSGGDMRRIQPPYEAIRYCLDAVGAELEDLATVTGNMPGRDWAPPILRAQLPTSMKDRILQVPSHHLAHAWSAWSPSGFEEAVVLVVDASGSTVRDADGRWTESYSIYRGGPAGLELLHSERVRAHLASISTLGFVYEEVTRMAGFLTRVGESLEIPEAGKLMGLASYGGPQATDRRWIRCHPGDYHLDIRAWEIRLECEALKKRFDGGDAPGWMRPWIVDLAYKVQNELELALCHLVQTAVDATGLTRLCLAGGVALNSVANHKIVTQCGLDDLFVFPAAGDGGIAAGCALWACHEVEGCTTRVPLRRATLGREPQRAEIAAAVEAFGDRVTCEVLSGPAILEQTTDALVQGRVVARYEGRCEYGPRALGHRSILVDPSFERMKDVLNARVKFREAFRPFAPVVPREEAHEIFELAVDSPFMLVVPPIREEHRAGIAAVVHEDGTGRVQTCSSEENPFLHGLCHALVAARGGLPVVLNTSFNVAGQPIVETPEQAIETFLSTDIDHLALGDYWLTKRGAAVRDYNEHLEGLEPSPLPRGLPAGRPGVIDLMQELDEAIHLGLPSRHWTTQELAAIAAEGAHLKETAVEFRSTRMCAPLQTQIGPDAALLLDPINGCRLVDLDGRRQGALLPELEADLLLALVHGDAPTHASVLRERFDVADWPDAVRSVADLLAEFGIEVDTRSWLRLQSDAPMDWSAGGPACAEYADRDHRDVAMGRLADRLRACGYEESALCALLGVDSLQQIEPERMHWLDRWKLDQTIRADLARLFLLRAPVPRERLRVGLGEDACRTLLRHGLIRAQGSTCRATVDLFVADELLFFTDHRFALREEDALDESPVMYVGLDSLGLVHTAPRQRVASALDLCCGGGIQGLVAAARYADYVTAVDVNPRAVRFARANADLNRISNHEVLLGDLYVPVDGRVFDLILANPPFVPSPQCELRFRDGGSDGEAILARIVQGAAERLTEGGRLAVVTDLVDSGRYQSKLEGWWGDAPADRLVLTTAARDEILFSEPHARVPFGQTLGEYEAELDAWVTNYRAAGLESVDFGYVLLWKLPTGRGRYVQRVVESPVRPVHRSVSAWKQSLDLRRMGVPVEFVPVPGLRITETRDVMGRLESAELTVPGNAFFTVYRVDEQTLEILRELASSSSAAPLDSVYEELLDLGLLLARGSGDERKRAVVESHPSLQVVKPLRTSGTARISRIEEVPTKTTPTCLSSYLR